MKLLTLTMEEIRHLAQFCGMVITKATDKEKEDERETEITIAPWPAKGVKGDDGMLPPHKHIAYYEEYPEEGCLPLGSPNQEKAVSELQGACARAEGIVPFASARGSAARPNSASSFIKWCCRCGRWTDHVSSQCPVAPSFNAMIERARKHCRENQ